MQLTTCALPGCSNPVVPGRTLPFRLGGKPEEYCSRGCVNIAFELMRKGKKHAKAQPEKVDYVAQDARQEAEEEKACLSPGEEVNMRVKAEEFGGAGVYRRYCDNPACKGPITVAWTGRRGEYCSLDCKKTEKENKNMTTEETTEETSPIASGAPASKKGKGKKAAPKAAPAKGKKAAAALAAKKTAAPKAAKGERDPRLPKVGTSFEHEHKGKTLKIDVLPEGFRHGKQTYKSLSALACAVTGYKTCNGFAFFKLG